MSSYRTDYTTRKILSGRPGLSTSYTYTAPSRQYVALDLPGRNTDESSYSRSYSSTVSSSTTSGTGPGSHTYKSERTTRDSGSGPRSYSYSTESTRSSDGRPGSYYSSVSYKSPYGNNYRNFSYK